MLVENLNRNKDGDAVSVIGQVNKFEGDYVFLKVNESTIKVKHNGIDTYKNRIVLVHGTVQDCVLVEKNAYKLEDEFDFESYKRFLETASNHSEIY
ncbi:hypothetical protein ECANGB1_1267 [Enterospora canceri]|uniref:Replication factor A protein 3 n=1 Tax=Enterospora canceri TaxID=1081671 RepID=A0A1Y1S6D6_9MICR|nr:hypothetical protein ECANGB1_1267 [Enterospora canceri]